MFPWIDGLGPIAGEYSSRIVLYISQFREVGNREYGNISPFSQKSE